MVADKVVVLLAHPKISESVANKALFEEAKKIEGVKCINLYDTKDEKFDLNEYAPILDEAKALVFQFPLYWASAPHLLKKWIDEVFTPLFSTPDGKSRVANKKLLCITTTASPYGTYRSGGRNQFTIDELLRPYQAQANHSGMKWVTPIAVYGIATPDAQKNIEAGKIEYKAALENLLKD